MAEEDPNSCLLWYGDGCTAIANQDLCLSTRDGRAWQEWKGMKIYGQPCVWCGGGKCSNTTGDHLCVQKSAVEDELSSATTTFTTAACANGSTSLPLSELPVPDAVLDANFEPAPTRGQLGSGQACRGNTVTDAGRPNNNYYWTYTANSLEQCQAFCLARQECSGVEYHAESGYCEVWWKHIYWTQAEPGYQCWRVVLANVSEPAGNPDRQCLQWQQTALGCAAATDRDTCMQSRDGRPDLEIRGLQIHGEPCAWCEGGACEDELDNNTRCQPLDWLQNGYKHLVFYNEISPDNITFADCEGSVPKVGGTPLKQRMPASAVLPAAEAATPKSPPSPPVSVECDGEMQFYLTTLSAPAEDGAQSIEVVDGGDIAMGQPVIISDLPGLDKDADAEAVMSRMATEGKNATTSVVAGVEIPGANSTVIRLEAALNGSFPAGSYVGSHTCKAAAAGAPVVLGQAAVLPGPASSLPWWLWLAFLALLLGCGMIIFSLVLKGKSKTRSARNATRRTRKIKRFDDEDDEESTPLMQKEAPAPQELVHAPVAHIGGLGNDPRLMPRTLTAPRLQVPYHLAPAAPVYYASPQPQHVVHLRPAQPMPATTMHPVSSVVMPEPTASYPFVEPLTRTARPQ